MWGIMISGTNNWGVKGFFTPQMLSVLPLVWRGSSYGEGPWCLGLDIDIVYTPGHTKGSVCLLYKPSKILFTGDHFTKFREDEFGMIEMYHKYSVSEQLKSVRNLLELEFEWILPGHGRRVHFKDVNDKNAAVETFLAQKEASLLQPN